MAGSPGRRGEGAVRVIVDFDRCDSNGLCADLAPEVFHVDDDDLLDVRTDQPDRGLWPAVEAAARACPKLAITLAETP
jgi:ferredoxin